MEQLVCEFQREVVAMSAVPPHPNVLRLVAACTEPPRLALVTDYCPLGSLYGVLHSPRPPGSQAWLLNVCLGVASGMAHLHHHRVLHRGEGPAGRPVQCGAGRPAARGTVLGRPYSVQG